MKKLIRKAFNLFPAKLRAEAHWLWTNPGFGFDYWTDNGKVLKDLYGFLTVKIFFLDLVLFIHRKNPEPEAVLSAREKNLFAGGD